MDVDPDELLTWLKVEENGERDVQVVALEQLCMLLLMSDNIDRCFEQYQPKLFLPALCDIFSDPHAPMFVLEPTARALTYFLDVSVDCAKKITTHKTVISSMCTCLQAVNVDDRTSKDLAEQIIKVFERICSREVSSVYENDGLRHVLDFINRCSAIIHKDSLQSALNVVVKLIGKLDPQNSTTLDQTIESLSKLLLHEDTFVSDNALRCFATLADRFARKSIDPEPLMRYCLKDVLLRSLHHVSKSVGHSSTNEGTGGVTTNISVVTGLLSALCRASSKVTEDLLRSDLLEALEVALTSGDERCVMDTLRFLDMLIGLLFEGRPTIVRLNRIPSTNTDIPTPPVSDQHQQQIIEHIRGRDFSAFVKYIEQNNIEVNYTDHVGQTILNWVSAFGTKEMVEYLCERGADVNRGQRSSSLHYAASFGRPSIIRLLLKYGANVDLRDEDGRTPIDKARERNDDTHQEILDLLQSANEWNENKSTTTEQNKQRSETEIEMQSIYFQRLLKIFAQLYQKTMILTIKRSTLRLISKLFQYATVQQIQETPFLSNIFELLATILDTNEDEDDTSTLALSIVKNLFEKDRTAFIEPLQYLGLISKITSLAIAHQLSEAKINTPEVHSTKIKLHTMRVDATEMVQSRLYLWKDFQLLRNRECLYIWNNYFVIELSLGSNGWFRYFSDGALRTMYSSGSPETNVDTDENRQDFLEKFQRLKHQIIDDLHPDKNDEKCLVLVCRPIFSSDASLTKTVTVGSWAFRCTDKVQLKIHNIEGEQATILEEGKSNFVFESNRGTQQVHNSNKELSEEFAIPWSTVESLCSENRKFNLTLNKNKQEQLKQRASEIAHFIYNEYIKNLGTNNFTRPILAELKSIVEKLNDEKINSSIEICQKLFEDLNKFFSEKTTLSIYELNSSGLVDVLLKIFQDISANHLSMNSKTLPFQRANLFLSVFLHNEKSEGFQNLIKKLILLFESIEKAPLFLYDSSLNAGLQIFSRRFRFRIQYQNEQNLFIDRNGKTINIEPLGSVYQLKSFLASMVSKPWYEYGHNHLEFVKQINEKGKIKFQYEKDFDQNGIFYWIGTNGKTLTEYSNPQSIGLISVCCPEHNFTTQQLSTLVNHQATEISEENKNLQYESIVIDLGLFFAPTHISLRHFCSSPEENWTKTIEFDLSFDNFRFVHCENLSIIQNETSTASWKFGDDFNSSSNFRFLRIRSNDSKSLVSISGVEIYGEIFSVVDIRTKVELVRSRSTREENRQRSSNSRSGPVLQHSVSVEPRAAKLQSTILKRIGTLNSTDRPTTNLSSSSLIDQIFYHFGSLPESLVAALESDDPENLRQSIEQIIATLTAQKKEPEISTNQMQTDSVVSTSTENNAETQNKIPNENSDSCTTTSFAPVNDSLQKSTSSVESLSAGTEENNKKNFNDMESETSPTQETNLPMSETVETSTSDPITPEIKQVAGDTSDDEEDLCLKRLQSNQQQIDAPMEDENEEDDQEQDQQEEEEYNDEFQEQMHGQQQTLTQKNWDDDFVLKRQFSVLLPAFDGRPGRTNINVTQEIPVPTQIEPIPNAESKSLSTNDALALSKMRVFLRPTLPIPTGLIDSSIELKNDNATIFDYVQRLIKPFPATHRLTRIKEIFQASYTIIYTEKIGEEEDDDEIIDASILAEDSLEHDKLTKLLQLLSKLNSFSQVYLDEKSTDENRTSIENSFQSKKLNNKLLKQMEDSMIVASSSFPRWTSWMTNSFRFFYPLESRQIYFRTSSFGTSRSIVWLQERREELIRMNRQGRTRIFNENSSTNSLQEFRFGRLRIHRATPIDRQEILRDSTNLFHSHAEQKSKLEIQFLNEEGTGDGPTLEFYGLVGHEFQKSNLGLWWNNEGLSTEFVNKPEGLFPIAYPGHLEKLDEISVRFSTLGILFGKCLMDRYLIDMPLSTVFLRKIYDDEQSDQEPDIIQDIKDLTSIEPARGQIFAKFFELIEKRRKILEDFQITDQEKIILCKSLKIDHNNHQPVDVEHLCLTFVFTPPSNDYCYQFHELLPNGANIDVTIDNLEEYLRLSLNFILRDGIRRQLDAFRKSFHQVFPLKHLKCFTPEEFRLILCGNQWPSWTLDDLLNYIEPNHGFTRESPGYVKFLNVMLQLDGKERKFVVQFITGCSSLPPGGLSNLRPRLSVARKIEADDNSYPSVNTCYHYLKLPDYSSEEILKERLMAACRERGFYLN